MNARRGSLRRRLLSASVLGFLTLVAGVVLTFWLVVSNHVRADFDAGLAARALSLASMIEQDEGQVEFEYAKRFFPEFEREQEPEYFQIWLADGLPLLRSTRLAGDLLAADAVPLAPELGNAVLSNARRVRVASLRFEPKGVGSQPATSPVDAAAPVDPPIVLVLAVGRGEEGLDRLLARLRFALFLAGGLAGGVGAWLLTRVVTASCRPIAAMAEQVQQLGADTLDQRLVLPDLPQELAPVANQINAMLHRLFEAMQRERRFAGNVAHELRTPVAELRSLAGVGSRWPEDREAVVGFFTDVRDVAVRMEGVIGNLLLLARCHGGAEVVHCSAVPLRALIDGTWRSLAQRAAAAGLQLRVDIETNLALHTDAGKFAILCTNLLANAVSHARPGTEIRCHAAQHDGRVEIEFVNAAEPMPQEHLRRLSEPFWRGDEARSSAEHAGLGLSVVTALAKLLSLTVEFHADADGTFRVCVGGPVGDGVASSVSLGQARPATATVSIGTDSTSSIQPFKAMP